MRLFQDSKDRQAEELNSSGEILGLDRPVGLSLGVALVTSALAAIVVVSDPSAAARLSDWSQRVESHAWLGGALPKVLPVTHAPFRYRIEEGVSIRQQLTNWSRHQGWKLDWEIYEAPPSAPGMRNGPIETPVDWPSARTLDFGEDFDRAFTSVVKVMNAERRQEGRPPLSATADFTTEWITVRLAEKEGSIAD